MKVRRRDALLLAAANGLEVWLWYAAAEYLFASAAPLLIHRDTVLDYSRWRGTVILLLCYAAWGLIMGLLAGVSMDGARDVPLAEFGRRNRKLNVLLMVAAFALNLALLPGQPGKAAALIATCAVAAAVLRDADDLAGCPWAVAAILIVTSRLAMVNWRNLPAVLSVPLTLVAAAVLLLAAVVALRLASRVRAGKFWRPVLGHGLIAATVIAMIFGPGAASSIFARSEMSAEIGSRAAHPAAARPLPNVILISLDTVRADHMGIYGYARQNTPNLAELSKESSLYTNSISASTLTLTSHASIFTGMYPQSHGAFKQFPEFPMGRPLAKGIPTIASILDAAGYRSMALNANLWYLVPEWGLVRGFEYSWTPIPLPLVEANHPYLLRGRIRDVLRDQPVASDFYSSPAVDAATITDRATTMLDGLRGQPAPFFLFINYMDAHWPYHAPAPFDSAYPGRDSRFNGTNEEAFMRTRVDCDGESVPSGYRAHAESQYDGAIAFLDFKLGELMRNLKKNGLFDNSLIIVTADHGETFGDRQYLGHNVSVYQDQIHVPLLVKYPAGRGPSRVDDLVSHIDLLPTILDVTGLAPRPELPGVSLLRLQSKPGRVILSERHYGPCQTRDARTPGVQYAVFQGSSKMISSSLGQRELYDLAKDPHERTDLNQIDPPLVLENTLREWIHRTPRLSAAQQPPDAEQIKRLRSLGYLQ